MATFVSLLLLVALVLVLYLGLGDWLLRLKQAAFAAVNVPVGVWLLLHGYPVAAIACLGIGRAAAIGVVEYFIHPLPRRVEKARLWALAVGFPALIILIVLLASGHYEDAPTAAPRAIGGERR